MTDSLREVTRSTLLAYADAWRAGDIDRILTFYDDDVVFHYFGSSEIAGTHVGKEASVAALARTASTASRKLVAVIDVLAGDELGSIVAIEEFARPEVGIEPVEVRRVFVYRVAPAGKVVECWVLDEDQALMDRLWS